jgi:ATP-dependent Clp protease ATP-binding subunit ClpC
MFERFTERARQVVVLAQDEARALKHDFIGPEHLLLGLAGEEASLAAQVLDALGITIEEIRADVARTLGLGDEQSPAQIPFTAAAKKVLELALREALGLGHNFVGSEHILLGALREDEGAVARTLRSVNADADRVRSELIRLMTGERPRPEGRWEYAVKTLEGASETWVEQLEAWRGDGWELITVLPEGGAYRAVVERRRRF